MPGETSKSADGFQLAIEEVRDEVRRVQRVVDIMGLTLKGILLGMDFDPKVDDTKK